MQKALTHANRYVLLPLFMTLFVIFTYSSFASATEGGDLPSLAQKPTTSSPVDDLVEEASKRNVFNNMLKGLQGDTSLSTGVATEDSANKAAKKKNTESSGGSNGDTSGDGGDASESSDKDKGKIGVDASGAVDDNLGSVGKIETVKEQLAYDEGMQLYLTQIILANDAKFTNTKYKNLYEGNELYGKDKNYGNANLYNYMLAETSEPTSEDSEDATDDESSKKEEEDASPDDEADAKESDDGKAADKAATNTKAELAESVKSMHAVYRMPLHYYDKNANTKDLAAVKQLLYPAIKKMDDKGADWYKANERDVSTDLPVIAISGDTQDDSLFYGDASLEEDKKVFSRGNTGGKYIRQLDNISSYSSYSDGLSATKGKATVYLLSDRSNFKHGTSGPHFPYNMAIHAKLYVSGTEIQSSKLKLSVDSYGNLISNDLHVLLPYWENMMIPQIDKAITATGKPFISSNFMKNTTYTDLLSKKSDKQDAPPLLHPSVYYSELASVLVGEKGELRDTNMKGLQNAFKEKPPYEKDEKKTLSSKTELDNTFATVLATEDSSKDLAEFIVGKTKDAVKEFNKTSFTFLSDIQEKGGTAELYVGKGGETNDVDAGDDSNTANTSAEGLIARIHKILDEGLFEMLRLTVAGAVSDFYNAQFMAFALGDIFHTSLLSDSQIWQNALNGILLLVVSFTAVYVAYLVLRLLLGYVDAKQIALRIVVLAIAVAAPMLLYSPLVNLIFNKPAEYVLNSEMKRMSVLDLWLHNETSALEKITSTRPGFNAQDLVRERKEDYTIQFVTNTTVDGYDIKAEDSQKLFGKYPNVNKMVTVDVSLFDIYEWMVYLETLAGVQSSASEPEKEESTSKDEKATEESGDDGEETTDKAQANPESDKTPTTDTEGDNAIETPKLPDKPEVSLFDYLVQNKGETYENLEKYTEFEYNTTTELNSIGKFKGNTYKASAMIYRTLAANEGLESSLLHYGFVGDILTALYFSENTHDEEGNPIAQYSDNEINQVLTDLSLTTFLRKEIYGTYKYSDFTVNFLKDVMGMDEETIKEMAKNDDILHMHKIVEPLNLVRYYGKRQLGQEVADVNQKVFDQYVAIYSPLTKIMESSGGTANFEDAKGFIIGMETFFAAVKSQNIQYFPTGIDTKNITLDTYVRSLFIPLSAFTVDNTDLDDVSSYIAINSDFASLIFFAISLFCLLGYGAIKYFVICILLMPLILISFFFNYVISNNVNSKAWLGSLMILLTFALSNLGLMVLWKGLIYFMSSQEVNTEVGIQVSHYPYVLAHAFALIVYFALVLKFMLIPLYKTVKGDIRNLGGETFSAKLGDMAAKFSGGIDGMLKNAFSPKNKGNASDSPLGTVKLDKDDDRLAMFARDKGRTQDMMTMMNPTETKDADTLNPHEAKDIDAINAKIDKEETSTQAGPTTLVDKVNKQKAKETKAVKGGIRKLANYVSNGTKDTFTNARRGIGRGLGTALDSGLSKVGDVSNSQLIRRGSSVLGTLLGSAAQTYVGGEVNKVVRGAEAVKDIANFTSQGVAAGANATTQLGRLLSTVGSRMKKPINSTVASAVAENLNKAKKSGSKYDNLRELSKEDLQQMQTLGIDREGSALDGVGAGRSETLTTIDTGNSTLSNLLASKLGHDGGTDAVSFGDSIYLNLSEEEAKDSAKRNQLIEDLYIGSRDIVDDMLSKEMIIEDVGAGPLAQQITSTMFNFGNDERYHEFIQGAVAKQAANGIDVESSVTAGNDLYVRYKTAAEAKLGIAEITEAIRIKSKVLDGALSPAYSVPLKYAKDFTKLLSDNDIVATHTTNGDSVAFRLQNHGADHSKLEEVLSHYSTLRSATTELSGNHLAVEDNAIVRDAFMKRVENQELELHKDVVVRGSSVIAISDQAKLALNSIHESYVENRANTIADVLDFTNKLNDTVLGTGEGIVTGTYDRHTNTAVEELLSNSLVGKEHFVMRNDFDFAASENLTNVLQRQRAHATQAAKENRDAATVDLLPEELEFLRQVDRIRTNDVIVERYDNSTVNIHAEDGKEAIQIVKQYMDSYEKAVEARKTADARQSN